MLTKIIPQNAKSKKLELTIRRQDNEVHDVLHSKILHAKDAEFSNLNPNSDKMPQRAL